MYLQIQMHNIFFMDIFRPVANLSKEGDAISLRQCEVVSHHPFEKFTTIYPKKLWFNLSIFAYRLF